MDMAQIGPAVRRMKTYQSTEQIRKLMGRN